MKWLPFPNDSICCVGLPWFEQNQPNLWRLPGSRSTALPDGVRKEMRHPTGARLCLRSNTSELRLRIAHPAPHPLGVDVYVNGQFLHTASDSEPGEIVCFADAGPTLKDVEIYLPIRHELQVTACGLDSNAECEKPASKAQKLPLVIYGSSVSQGVGASRPGMSYAAILSRHLNIDHVNLGFGGAGKAEPEVVDLLAQVNACCYLLDLGKSYGMQPAGVYSALLATLRERHPHTPIVCVTPIFSSRELSNEPFLKLSHHTRSVVRQSVAGRPSQDDGFVHLVEGETLLSAQDTAGLTDDEVHPNDFGHGLIAERIELAITNALQTAN